MQRLLIVGSSGHARVIIDIFERQADTVIVGLIDDFKNVGELMLDYRILGREADISTIVSTDGVTHLFIAVGDNATRATIANRLREKASAIPFATAIHPSASIGKSTTIFEGSSVMAGAVVGPACIVGRHCIVNSTASLEHDSIMADYSSIAPGACAGGGCKIGEFASICIGATISHNMTIGAEAVVGAGALVLSDIAAFSVSYGVPARHVRFRTHADKYL